MYILNFSYPLSFRAAGTYPAILLSKVLDYFYKIDRTLHLSPTHIIY
nr:MAG TPA: hypothetical protein [Caudoviricetes sp.]